MTCEETRSKLQQKLKIFFFRVDSERYWNVWITKFYFRPHLRIGAWTIGIILGYFLYEKRGKKFEINKTLDALLWIFFISLFFLNNFTFYFFVQESVDTTNMLPHVLYGSFFRVIWSLSVAWIIFACQNGSGGIIRWFLSLHFWQPLGRMGLSIYLTHRVYQFITSYNEKQPIQWDFFTLFQKFYGDVLVAIFLGIILYLVVETPVMLVESSLHSKVTKSTENANKGNA
jgi:hypothetical protein